MESRRKIVLPSGRASESWNAGPYERRSERSEQSHGAVRCDAMWRGERCGGASEAGGATPQPSERASEARWPTL